MVTKCQLLRVVLTPPFHNRKTMIGYFRNIVYFTILILLINLIIRSSFTQGEGDLISEKIPMLENEHFTETSVKNSQLITLTQSNSINYSYLKTREP